MQRKGCDGQRTHSAQKIEEAVLEIVRQCFSHFGKSVDAIWKEQQRLQIKQGSGARLKQAEMGLGNSIRSIRSCEKRWSKF